MRGAERLGVPREEEDARRLLVEPVDEREVLPELLAQRAEESARAVDRDSGPLVDREVGVGAAGATGGAAAAPRPARSAALRKRSAERMTARLPAMFAAMPITIGVWWKRIP